MDLQRSKRKYLIILMLLKSFYIYVNLDFSVRTSCLIAAEDNSMLYFFQEKHVLKISMRQLTNRRLETVRYNVVPI